MYYERPKKNRNIWSYFIVALVAALIGGTISMYIAPKYIYGKLLPTPEIYANGTSGAKEGVNITPTEDISAVQAVAKKSMGSVVGITTVQVQRRFIWEEEVSGSGSGVIISPNGYILTNSHVVGDGEAKDINVLFENGDQMPGKVLWNDAYLDLAIVKVNATGLPAADLGDSDTLEVGQLAVAIGNPLGLDFQRTVTSGVISGLNRSIRVENTVIEDLIQTDASINPGNSGGPLLNSKGEVIGINTVKIRSDAAEGLGFAIPINIPFSKILNLCCCLKAINAPILPLIKYIAIIISSNFKMKLSIKDINIFTIKASLTSINIATSNAAAVTGII